MALVEPVIIREAPTRSRGLQPLQRHSQQTPQLPLSPIRAMGFTPPKRLKLGFNFEVLPESQHYSDDDEENILTAPVNLFLPIFSLTSSTKLDLPRAAIFKRRLGKA